LDDKTYDDCYWPFFATLIFRTGKKETAKKDFKPSKCGGHSNGKEEKRNKEKGRQEEEIARQCNNRI